ncbi:MAG: hypothetical protein MRZ36_04040 [Eubacterium sp.]|nr:hypothetical protein [Eubacterium sp.]
MDLIVWTAILFGTQIILIISSVLIIVKRKMLNKRMGALYLPVIVFWNFLLFVGYIFTYYLAATIPVLFFPLSNDVGEKVSVGIRLLYIGVEKYVFPIYSLIEMIIFFVRKRQRCLFMMEKK